jgi:3-phosphoshikimate 1-carboxyvinyltransferase
VKYKSSNALLNGSVLIPSSKSHTVRALIFGLLADGTSVIRNPLISGDTEAALSAVRGLGAEVEELDGVWNVKGLGGKIVPAENVVDVLNSGTTLYIAMTVAALADGSTVFTGDEQIRSRPAENLMKALRDLGATAYSTRGNGCAPLVIGGPVKGGETSIECPTSQYLSSLLIGLPLADNKSVINVPLLHEQPYVVMTLKWLSELGIKIAHNEDMSRFDIEPGQKYKSFDKQMAGDFSTATFFLCAAAISGKEVTLEGLDMTDTQGDKQVVEYLRSMGAVIDECPEGLKVNGSQLKGAVLDLNATPDALPAIAAAACFAEGKTEIVNVPQARLKETDRIAVMYQELKKLGADIEELEDGLVINGGTLKGGEVCGHADHRVVMSLCLAGLRTEGCVTVDTAEAVAVTFPDFAEIMNSLGAAITEVD